MLNTHCACNIEFMNNLNSCTIQIDSYYYRLQVQPFSNVWSWRIGGFPGLWLGSVVNLQKLMRTRAVRKDFLELWNLQVVKANASRITRARAKFCGHAAHMHYFYLYYHSHYELRIRIRVGQKATGCDLIRIPFGFISLLLVICTFLVRHSVFAFQIYFSPCAVCTSDTTSTK